MNNLRLVATIFLFTWFLILACINMFQSPLNNNLLPPPQQAAKMLTARLALIHHKNHRRLPRTTNTTINRASTTNVTNYTTSSFQAHNTTTTTTTTTTIGSRGNVSDMATRRTQVARMKDDEETYRKLFHGVTGNYSRHDGESLLQWNPSEHRRHALKETPAVEYLGVLVDAGRFYYPIPWLYTMIDYISSMGFNLIHFRLTDDQAFNIQLERHPELALPAPGENQTYSVKELRNLVHYADQKGIAIMPEIDLPVHAGAWGGSHPYLIVPCVRFICRKNFGVPLNISHALLMPLIRDVLEEVKGIFTTAPFLHLGGDELSTAKPCYMEMGEPLANYTTFENDLRDVLSTLNIDPTNVVRWEVSWTDNHLSASKVVGHTHYWMGRPHKDLNKPPPTSPYLISTDLYFDANGQQSAWDIFKLTKAMIQQHDDDDGQPNNNYMRPKAVIAGTFELGVNEWFDRNVLGRLLAVAMGASTTHLSNQTDFESVYQENCKRIQLPATMCNQLGVPMLDERTYKEMWKKLTSSWRTAACDRLVVSELNMYGQAVNLRPKVGALI